MLINLSLVPPNGTIYDPFCGVGTLPAEGALMGLTVVASDRSEEQIRRKKENLAWLVTVFPPSLRTSREARTFVHDLSKGPFPLPPQSVDAVVTEGWLGPARTTAPPPREAAGVFETAARLLSRLLQRAAPVLRPGGRVLVAVPAFRVKKRVLHFPFERVRAPWYTRESFALPRADHPLMREPAAGPLLYGRPDAIVLREIVRYRKR
jgi:tRNA G10  N-methylase Trm11